MLTAYVDESGHETKDWMFVAGFLGSEQQWNNCAHLWREALGKRSHLHMKALRWGKDRTRQLLARLGPIPNQCNLTPVLAGVKVSDYEDLLAGTPAQKLLKGYVTCVYPLVLNILRSIPRNERLEIVFEQQSEYEPFADCALAAIVTLRHSRPDWFVTGDGQPKLAKWSFVPKGSTILTEPADYFVYALRHLYQDKHSLKTKWCQPILDSGDGTAIGAIFKRHEIRQAIIELPYRAIYSEALRKSGKLEELNVSEETKKRIRELRM